MSEERALLAGIKAGHPDDNTARLVYADWLEEHDQGHIAATIRENVDLRVKSPGEDDYIDVDWAVRMHAFNDLDFEPWFGPTLEAWLNGDKGTWRPTTRRVRFDRGTLVLCGAPFQFQDRPARLLKPFVNKLHVTGPQGGISGLDEAINDLEVNELTFESSNQYVNQVMGRFLHNPSNALHRLVYLDLGGGVSMEQLIELAGWSAWHVKRLEQIRIGPGQMGSRLSQWNDPHARLAMIRDMMAQLTNRQVTGGRGAIVTVGNAALKKVKYLTHMNWRF